VVNKDVLTSCEYYVFMLINCSNVNTDIHFVLKYVITYFLIK